MNADPEDNSKPGQRKPFRGLVEIGGVLIAIVALALVIMFMLEPNWNDPFGVFVSVVFWTGGIIGIIAVLLEKELDRQEKEVALARRKHIWSERRKFARQRRKLDKRDG